LLLQLKYSETFEDIHEFHVIQIKIHTLHICKTLLHACFVSFCSCCSICTFNMQYQHSPIIHIVVIQKTEMKGYFLLHEN